MPPRTPPRKVLQAVRNFAREEFGFRHRYAMVLHTDEPHPHVHVLIKAVSEQGQRLNIRKETLRQWRQAFARQLRVLGIEANATERAVRGQTRLTERDGIFRSGLRGDSSHLRQRMEVAANELGRGGVRLEPGKSKVLRTRHAVREGWLAASELLMKEGRPNLAAEVKRFLEQMASPMTEKEAIAVRLLERARNASVREGAPRIR